MHRYTAKFSTLGQSFSFFSFFFLTGKKCLFFSRRDAVSEIVKNFISRCTLGGIAEHREEIRDWFGSVQDRTEAVWLEQAGWERHEPAARPY